MNNSLTARNNWFVRTLTWLVKEIWPQVKPQKRLDAYGNVISFGVPFDQIQFLVEVVLNTLVLLAGKAVISVLRAVRWFFSRP